MRVTSRTTPCTAMHSRPSVGMQCLARQQRPQVAIPSRTVVACARKQAQQDTPEDWYEFTRQAARPKRTVREEIEYRRRANELANNGKERKDLYTDNWDGSEYKGSPFNVLTLLAALFVLVPVAGLVFAYMTYGVLWG